MANLYPLDLRRIEFVCLAGDSEETIDLASDAYKNGTDFYDIVIQRRSFTLLNGACDCPTGIAYTNVSGTVAGCKTTEKKLFVTLTSAPNQTPPDPRPVNTGGRSTLELIAKVTENGNPKAGVAVTFEVEVVAKSGGHGHHDASRPKGKVIASENKTDAKGEIKLTFNASDVAGSHTITATCDSCSNKFVENKVDVKVPDLAPISPNASKNADGSSQYAFTAKDPTHIGASGGPRGEYYLTAQAATNLDVLVTNFAEEGWGTVAFNDASLVWGGLYDIENNWMPSHQGHRVGEEIDISFTRANNPISTEKRKKIYKTFCEDKKASVPFRILYHIGGKGPHYHVYLLGRKNGCFTLPT